MTAATENLRIDALIRRVEMHLPVERAEFRHAELAGALAPHFFHENPLDAFCQDCGLRVEFEGAKR